MKRTDFTKIIIRVQEFASEMAGVFTYADLCSLTGASSELKTKRLIKRLVTEGILFKIQRGYYTTKEPDLWVLACRLKKNACVSLDSALARQGLIGTVPRSVSLIYPGARKEVLNTPFGLIRYFSIKKELIFGFQSLAQGVRVTDSEKSYLDILYYYVKGAKFAVDPRKDIDVWKLDQEKVELYLKRYRNPKFRRFVKGLLHG